MRLLTVEDRARLVANGALRRQADQDAVAIDFLPVVKLFTPDANCTWLLTEFDPGDTDRAFGLCDLGFGFPELGYVSLTELLALRGRSELHCERDLGFVARYPLSVYAEAARKHRATRTRLPWLRSPLGVVRASHQGAPAPPILRAKQLAASAARIPLLFPPFPPLFPLFKPGSVRQDESASAADRAAL